MALNRKPWSISRKTFHTSNRLSVSDRGRFICQIKEREDIQMTYPHAENKIDMDDRPACHECGRLFNYLDDSFLPEGEDEDQVVICPDCSRFNE